MIKVKDGYGKLIGSEYKGSADQVLLSDGSNLGYAIPSTGNTLVLRNTSGQIESSLTTDSNLSPFVVTSTVVNTNLNSDLLDGFHAGGLFQTLSSSMSVNLTVKIGNTEKKIEKLYATYDGLGNTIAAKYVTLDTAQTVSGVKTFSSQQKFTVSSVSPFTVDSNIVVTNLNADLLDGTHKADLFTDFSNITSGTDANKVSITIGGTTKKIIINYAQNAGSIGGITADGLFTDLSSTPAKNLSITIGGTTKELTSLYSNYWVPQAIGGKDFNTMYGDTYRGTSWYGGGSNTATNNPLGSGQAFGMQVWRNADGYTAQLIMGSDGRLYVRVYNGSSWSQLQKFAYATDAGQGGGYWANLPVQAIADSTTTPTFGGVTVNGTSLLNGQVGIGILNPKAKLAVNISALSANPTSGSLGTLNTMSVGAAGSYGTYFWTRGTGKGYIQVGREDGTATTYDLILQLLGGNVGIGTENPIHKLQVAGAGVFNNTNSTTYATNGITIGAGDATARYITCYGKTGLSYINVGYGPGINNSGEFFFNYVSNGSTSNYSGVGIYGGANYMYLYPDYTTFRKPLVMPGELYSGNCAINMSNSDIININALYTADNAESGTEGLQFSRGNGYYDSVWAASGVLYFSPNGNLNRTGSYSTNYTVLHTGNYTSNTAESKYWTAKFNLNTWSRILSISDYVSVLVTIGLGGTNEATVHTYLVSTGWNCARIVQIGNNGFSSYSNIQVRITRTSTIQYYLEVYHTYNYNGNPDNAVCRFTKLSEWGAVTPITTITAGGGTVCSSLTSSATVAMNFYAERSLYTDRLNGFSVGGTQSQTWGNQTGTGIHYENDSTGGSFEFRRDNPSSGKVSLKLDGRVYVSEGNYPVLSSTFDGNGYPAILTPDGASSWIRVTNSSSYGLLPYTSGSAGNGHNYIGTSSWYFYEAYIDHIYGRLHGAADSASSSGYIWGNGISNLNTPTTWSSDGTRLVYDTYSGSASNKPVSVDNANGLVTFFKSKHGVANQYVSQLAFPDHSRFYFRYAANGSWGSWQTVAFTSDIPNPANYYWANIRVSASSSTGTQPTFNTCWTSNWFRSTGATGWYNETYQGGIHMQDSTWVRTHNGKSFYCSAVIQAGNRIYTGYDSGEANSISCSNWFRSNGTSGWYNPTYGCHVYPNNINTYGGLVLRGTKNGYHGFILGENTNYMNLMDNSNDKGLYQEGKSWILYYNRGYNRVGLLTSSLAGYAVTTGGDVYIRSGWVRTEGARGWYNESYGGGMYMEDSTWVRVHGGKKFYVSNSEYSAIHSAGGVYVAGAVHSYANVLKSTCNSRTISIGSQNSSWCHYSTDAPAHWFNKPIYVYGDLYGGSGYNRRVAYADEITNSWRGVENVLTSTSTSNSLTANMGRVLANGASDRPIVLLAGTLYRSGASSSYTTWYFTGYRHRSISSSNPTVYVSGGVARFYFTNASGYGFSFAQVCANHQASGEATGYQSGEYQTRSSGLFWFGTYTSGQYLYIRAIAQGDRNNDTAESYTGMWTNYSDGVTRVSIIAVGYAW